MSLLRLLSPNRESVPSTASQCSNITLDIRMPTHGMVFMKPPDDPLWPHARSPDLPREDEVISGVLEIRVPSGGRRRCRSIRVGWRTKCKLEMGAGRGWEEDTIFERKAEILGGNSEGIVLEEGLQLFEITLILPSTLAANDRHDNGRLDHELFAEVEGIPEPDGPLSQASSLFGFGRRLHPRSPFGSATHSRNPSRSPSPMGSPRTPLPSSPSLLAVGNLAITRQEEASFALAPTYEQSQATNRPNEDEWVVGTIGIVKSSRVIHNPNPTGEVSDLNITQTGVLPALGIWELKLSSDMLSVAGPIHARFALPSPDPKVTIFAWSLSLRQTHTVMSPRDDPAVGKPITTTRVFTVIRQGVKPEGVRNPGLEVDALWRGDAAGGNQGGECVLSASASLPLHEHVRATTLPAIITPIEVSHTLQFQLYFSVWSEDDQGRPMRQLGPGGMRHMDIRKKLILPSCLLIASSLDLPKYVLGRPDEPCTECGGLFDISGNVKTPTISAFQHLSNIPPVNASPAKAVRTQEHWQALPPQAKLCRACRAQHDSVRADRYGWLECACDLTAGDMAERIKALDVKNSLGADRGEATNWKASAEGS